MNSEGQNHLFPFIFVNQANLLQDQWVGSIYASTDTLIIDSLISDSLSSTDVLLLSSFELV